MKRPRIPRNDDCGAQEDGPGASRHESVRGGQREGRQRDDETMRDEAALGLRVHEWGLNPLFWSYVKLLSRDVHALGTLDGIDDSHVLCGMAAHRVEVSGIVVHVKPGAIKGRGTYVKYIIDDGTGLLPCTQYERIVGSGAVHAGRAELHELGELLIVQGKLKRYKGAREVVITSARKPVDANEETLHWLRCIELAQTVYKPGFRRKEYVDDALVTSSSQARPTRCECGAAYADAVGYCRCVAASLTMDPSFEFRDALLAHLAAKEEALPPGEHLRFQFASHVRDDPFLKEVALSVVSSARSRAESSDRGRGSFAGTNKGNDKLVLKAKIMDLFRGAVSSLHRDGLLHFLDKAEDVYVLISRGRLLQPSVEAVCRERGLELTQENEIIRALQGSSFFHHVSGARIRACVHRMNRLMQADHSSCA